MCFVSFRFKEFSLQVPSCGVNSQSDNRARAILVKQTAFICLFILNLLHAGNRGESCISIDCVDQPLVTVLSEVHGQTQARFVYDADLVEGKRVTCKVENKKLEDALPVILHPCQLNFQIYPDQVVVLYQDTTFRNILRGCVFDSLTGEGLPYANILIDGGSVGTAADASGNFSLDYQTETVCTLKVQYIGYQAEKLILDSRDITDLAISLKEKPILTRNVVVHSTGIPDLAVRQSGGHIDFKPENIGYLPAHTPSDILQCLQTMSGTRAINEYLNGLYVNSGTPDQNLVLLDGIPLFYAEHLWGYINLFQSHAIRRVDLLKSGFPVRYGDKLSSVIELEGKSCDIGRPRVGVGADFFSLYGYIQSPIFKQLRGSVSVRKAFNQFALPDHYYHTEDYLYMAKRRYMTNLYHGKVFNYFDVLSKLEYDYGSDNRLALTFFTGQDEFNLTKFEESNSRLVGNRLEKWRNTGVGLNWEFHWIKKLKTQLTVAYSYFRNLYNYYLHYHGLIEQVLPDGSLRHHEFDYIINEVDEDKIAQGQIKLSSRLRFNPFFNFEFGGEYSQTQLAQKFPEEQIWNNPYYNPPQDLIVRIPETKRDNQQALFIENVSHLGRSSSRVGLRAVHLSGFKKVYLEPRFSITVSLFRPFSLNMHWGRYNQSIHRISPKVGDGIPLRTSFFWAVSDERFQPAGVDHATVGFQLDFEDYLLKMDFYSKQYRNLLHLLPYQSEDDAQFIAVDKGIGRARGFELSIMKKHGFFSGWFSYHLSRSDYQLPHVNEGLSFYADHDRTHEINLVNRLSWQGWNLTLFGIYASGCPYTPTDEIFYTIPVDYDCNLLINHKDRNTGRLPDYRRLDVTFMRQIKDLYHCHIDCGVTLLNVLGHRNVLDRYYQNTNDSSFDYLKNDMPGLPFTVSLFVNVEFDPGF